MVIALTGHTRGLGAIMHAALTANHHQVLGFSLSNGYDLRDYSQVGRMIQQTEGCAWFINCAKPDYAQSQILYRLMASGFAGRILNVGSPVVHKDPGWEDLGLLEYATQKVALHHAHAQLSRRYPGRLFMWEPNHAQDAAYVTRFLESMGL